MWQDRVNAAFEMVAVLAVSASCVKVWRTKSTGDGVSYWHVAYSSASACWFAYYYQHLDQWWSFTIGLLYLVAVVFWAGLLLSYARGTRGQ
jgi:hypothetical protein